MSSKKRPELKRIIDDLDAQVRSDIVGFTSSFPTPLVLDSFLLPTPRSLMLFDGVRDDPRYEDAIYAGLTLASRERLFAIEDRLDQIEEISLLARGRELRAAKALLIEEKGHGYWLDWLKYKGTPATTATALVRAAEWIGETAIVAAMPVGAIYRGANAPIEVKRTIEERVAAKEVVTLKIVKDLIAQHRADKKNDPVRLEKERLKEQRREKRLERELRKVREEYARADAQQANVAVEIVTTLIQALDHQAIRVLLDRWRTTTLFAVEKAFLSRCADTTDVD